MQPAPSKYPETYSQILGHSIRLFKGVFRHAYFFALLVAVIVFIPRIICVAVGQNVFLTSSHFSGQQVLFVAMYISSLWFLAAMLWDIHCIERKKPDKFINDIKMAGKRMLLVLGAALLLLCIGFISLYLSNCLNWIFVKFSLYSHHLYIKSCLLFLVLLVRAGLPVFFGLLFYFYFPLIVLENDGIFYALKQSAELVWGHAWRTFWLILTPWLIYLATIIAIKIIFGVNIHVYLMPFESVSTFSTTFLHILILSFFILWAGSIMLVQLQDLELRKKAALKKK